MLPGMEDYELCKFDRLEDVEGAVLAVLDRDLEVFDPLVDGSVEQAEGMAMAREIVEKTFKEIRMQREKLLAEEEMERE